MDVLPIESEPETAFEGIGFAELGGDDESGGRREAIHVEDRHVAEGETFHHMEDFVYLCMMWRVFG